MAAHFAQEFVWPKSELTEDYRFCKCCWPDQDKLPLQAVKELLDAGDKPNYRVFPGCVKNNNSPSGMGNHITDFARRCSQHSAAVPADSRATRFGPKPAVGNASVPVSEEKARDWAVEMVLQDLLPIDVVESVGGKRWLKKHAPGMCGKTKLTKVTDEVIQDIRTEVREDVFAAKAAGANFAVQVDTWKPQIEKEEALFGSFGFLGGRVVGVAGAVHLLPRNARAS